MPWRRPLHTDLADAVPLADYLDGVASALAPWDFAPERTFAAVSICRDELTQHLITAVTHRWDHPFSLGGLGGLPSLGRTGWGACLSHVPGRGGRGHLLVLGLPHVGVDPEGNLGASLRRHQDEPTPTCGALGALFASLGTSPGGDDHGSNPALATEGAEGAEEDGTVPIGDAEAARLRRLVTAELDGPPEDLLALTRAAALAVHREMWQELEALEPWTEMDVAVFTGIQVHLPDDRPDHVLGLSAELRAGPTGEWHELRP